MPSLHTITCRPSFAFFPLDPAPAESLLAYCLIRDCFQLIERQISNPFPEDPHFDQLFAERQRDLADQARSLGILAYFLSHAGPVATGSGG